MVGILSCGLQWTMVHTFMSIPDHGLWTKGTNKLYIHRVKLLSLNFRYNVMLQITINRDKEVEHCMVILYYDVVFLLNNL